MAEARPLDPVIPLGRSTHLARSLPYLQGLRYKLTLHIIQWFISIGLRLIELPLIRNPSILPKITKSYASHPSLTHRIFIPKSRKPSDPPLPLYIDIHGGGFSWSSPVVDDTFCSTLSNAHNVVVVSLDYPKAPTHRFPTAINVLTDLIHAVLADATLPFDEAKVSIGGFSAGANLAFGVSQAESLQGKLKGIVAFYPAVNFVERAGTMDEAVKEEVDTTRPVLPQDMLSMFAWGYVVTGQDLTDPRLSPVLADRTRLPHKMFIIGCEFDSLCAEAQNMAEKMAGDRNGPFVPREGDLIWQSRGVTWEKVLGEDHAFDMRLAFGAEKLRMKKRAKELYKSVGDWLLKEVYF